MENWDEDFSTIKGAPEFLPTKRRSLSSWRADVPIADGDATLKRGQHPSAAAAMLDMSTDFDDDDDEDFADNFEMAVRNHQRKPQPVREENLPDAFLSDSTSRSPSRSSVSSSAASVSSMATSWGVNEDQYDFDFDEEELPDPKLDLAARYAAREERARAEAAAEAAQLQENYARTVRKNRSPAKKLSFTGIEPDDDDDNLLDLGLEQLTLRVKNGTVNKNVKLQPTTASAAGPSKLLRGMRSIAQLPMQKKQDAPPAPSKLRGAVSMLDLGSSGSGAAFASPQRPRLAPQMSSTQLRSGGGGNLFGTPAPGSALASLKETQLDGGDTLRPGQRPLTAYREPAKSSEFAKTTRKHGTKKHRKPNLIQNPVQTLKRQERNGMVLNPHTGLWEGNEVDASRFDLLDGTGAGVRPTLITKRSIEQELPQTAPGMLFDSRTLSWVYANESEYDDPFADIDDAPASTPSPTPQLAPTSSAAAFRPSHSKSPSAHSLNTMRLPGRRGGGGGGGMQNARVVTNDSLASSATMASSTKLGRASVTRSETSSHEVFEVTPAMAAEWRHADERFIRKFGKWIGGDEERADTLQSDQQFYEMVKNA